LQAYLQWWNAIVSPSPLVLILFGETAFPKKNIWGNGVPPHSPSTAPLMTIKGRLGFSSTANVKCFQTEKS